MAKDVNIFFIFSIINVVLHNVLWETTAFVVEFIVPPCATVNIFRINFHSHVRVRYLPFGCVVR